MVGGANWEEKVPPPLTSGVKEEGEVVGEEELVVRPREGEGEFWVLDCGRKEEEAEEAEGAREGARREVEEAVVVVNLRLDRGELSKVSSREADALSILFCSSSCLSLTIISSTSRVVIDTASLCSASLFATSALSIRRTSRSRLSVIPLSSCAFRSAISSSYACLSALLLSSRMCEWSCEDMSCFICAFSSLTLLS